MEKYWNVVLLVPCYILKILFYNLTHVGLMMTKHNTLFSHWEFPCMSISVFFIVLGKNEFPQKLLQELSI